MSARDMLYNLAFHHFIGNFARRPLADRSSCFSGCSQASASILQRWSAVIRLGAPGRGPSRKRSSMLKSSSEIPCNLTQRFRQSRTVSCVTWFSSAIRILGFPSADASTILARNAICCAVWCCFTNFSNPCCSFSERITGCAFGFGIFCTLVLTSFAQSCHFRLILAKVY